MRNRITRTVAAAGAAVSIAAAGITGVVLLDSGDDPPAVTVQRTADGAPLLADGQFYDSMDGRPGHPTPFTSPLCEFDNVILTPHIGGSTQEAQENIGLEVAGKLIKYSDNGSTLSAVNFPEVSLPLHGGRRLLHIHENRPGVLTAINQIFAAQSINIAAQYLQTSPQMGYVVIDIEAEEDVAQQALQAMKAIPGTIRARLLF